MCIKMLNYLIGIYQEEDGRARNAFVDNPTEGAFLYWREVSGVVEARLEMHDNYFAEMKD